MLVVFIQKALEKKIWSLEMVNIRDYATDKHKTVDDTPFGGGSRNVNEEQMF